MRSEDVVLARSASGAARASSPSRPPFSLRRGADRTLRDKEGKSAADLARLTAIREKLSATN